MVGKKSWQVKALTLSNFTEVRPDPSALRRFLSTMSDPRDVPNPLRPYHIPTPAVPPPATGPADGGASRAGPSSASKHASSVPKTNVRGSSAHDVLPDFDYGDYLPDASPPVAELLKSLLDQGLWKYTSVLLAQPFELAKTILQVQDAGTVTEARGMEDERVTRKPRARGFEGDHDVCEVVSGEPDLMADRSPGLL